MVLKEIQKATTYREGSRTPYLVAFCSPAKSLTFSGLMEYSLVGKRLKNLTSQQNAPKHMCTCAGALGQNGQDQKGEGDITRGGHTGHTHLTSSGFVQQSEPAIQTMREKSVLFKEEAQRLGVLFLGEPPQMVVFLLVSLKNNAKKSFPPIIKYTPISEKGHVWGGLTTPPNGERLALSETSSFFPQAPL